MPTEPSGIYSGTRLPHRQYGAVGNALNDLSLAIQNINNYLEFKSEEILNVKAVGARGDSFTDDTEAIQRALDSSYSLIYFPPGIYKVSSTLNMPNIPGKTLIGANPSTTRITTSSATNDILVCAYPLVRVIQLGFYTSVTRSAGIALTLSAAYSMVVDCYFESQFVSVKTTGAINKVLHCNFREKAFGGKDIWVSGGDTSPVIHDCMSDSSASHGGYGIFVDDVAALTISDTSMIHAGTALGIEPGNGQYVASLKIHDSFFDTSDVGILIKTTGTGVIIRCKFFDVWTASHFGNGLHINAAGGDIDGLDFYGLEAHTSTTGDGVLVEGGVKAKNIHFHGGSMGWNAGAGISIQNNCQKIRMHGLTSGACDGLSVGNATGIFVGTGCTNIRLQDCNISGNTGVQVNTSSSLIATGNVGYKTKNHGALQVSNGTTSTVVTHGLARPPENGEIFIVPLTGLGAASKYMVGSITSTQFTVTVDVNPGADIFFAWSADTEGRNL